MYYSDGISGNFETRYPSGNEDKRAQTQQVIAVLQQMIIGDGVQLITVLVQYLHYIVSVTKMF